MPASIEHAARIGRGFLATASLFLLAAWTVVVLTVGVCGFSSDVFSERIGDPWIWCMLASYPVPLAALPPFSQRLRGRPWRWVLVPSLLAVAGYTYDMVSELDPREPGSLAILLALVVPLLVCAVYVGLRVVRPGAS